MNPGGHGLDLEDVTFFVRRLATEQGEVVLRRWPEAVSTVNKDRRDFATQVDLEVERQIKNEIRARFPEHGLSGEETAGENPMSDYQWLIDPIDGTKYYAAGSSLFTVSIGLLFRREPILGVVYNASSRQCFYAWQAGGAHLDGQRLSGSTCDDLTKAIINVDTPRTHALPPAERQWFEAKLLQLTRRVYRVRALGIGSLSACWLASGALDAYVDLTGYVKPQDMAAGRVILHESGVKMVDLEPDVGPRRLLAAPPGVFEALRQLFVIRGSLVRPAAAPS